jgi:hypothetical protein
MVKSVSRISFHVPGVLAKVSKVTHSSVVMPLSRHHLVLVVA